jgi:hypothetical protein
MKNKRAVQYRLRNIQLKTLGFDSYQEYLKSPLWMSIRKMFHKRWKGKPCQCCGMVRKLIPHHIKYKGIDKINLSSIMPVCESCHSGIHAISNKHSNLTIKQATKRWRRRFSKPATPKQKKGIKPEKKEKVASMNLTKKAIVVGIGEKCPKCGKDMERRKHPPHFVSRNGHFFTEWDFCPECKHVQHYAQYKHRDIS